MTGNEYFRTKSNVPSGMSSAEWATLAQWQREKAFFSSTVTEAEILATFRTQADDVSAGPTDSNTAIKLLQMYLRGIDYQPANPEDVGTIRDLRTVRRLQTMLETNRELAHGYAQRVRGLIPGALLTMPAWELIRIGSDPQFPRDWPQRWESVGGELRNGRMIALKTDLIWAELGNIGNFPDALGVDHPPFAWGSGMGWRGVPFSEADALGLEPSRSPQNIPIRSSNENVTIPLDLPQLTRAEETKTITALQKKLMGTAVVDPKTKTATMLDPHGTRPISAHHAPKIIMAALPAGFIKLQQVAVDQLFAKLFDGATAAIANVFDLGNLLTRIEPTPIGRELWASMDFPTASARRAWLATPGGLSAADVPGWLADRSAVKKNLTGSGYYVLLHLPDPGAMADLRYIANAMHGAGNAPAYGLPPAGMLEIREAESDSANRILRVEVARA